MTKAITKNTNILKNDDHCHHDCHHHVDTTIEREKKSDIGQAQKNINRRA
jgi:hypothetical protein